MEQDSELLDRVIIFLIVLVSAIIVFSQYQFYEISKGFWQSYLAYASIALILALLGLIAWMFTMHPENAHKPFEGHAGQRMHHAEKIPKPWTFMEKLSYSLVAFASILIIFNQVQISQISALSGFSSGSFALSSGRTILTGNPAKDALSLIPKGTRFYSQSLGVSFDDPIRSLDIIAELDPAYGRNKVQLSPEEKARYIKIGTIPTMGCEFCCGATTAVTSDGRPTCGCKHSWATRGLLAYLVKNYPQLSDDEIMHSLAEWKVMFFPKQMLQRYVQETQTGRYTPDIRALLLDSAQKNANAVVPAASAGNSQGSSDVAAAISSLPSQVGGC